jgi:hypothetical protein
LKSRRRACLSSPEKVYLSPLSLARAKARSSLLVIPIHLPSRHALSVCKPSRDNGDISWGCVRRHVPLVQRDAPDARYLRRKPAGERDKPAGERDADAGLRASYSRKHLYVPRSGATASGRARARLICEPSKGAGGRRRRFYMRFQPSRLDSRADASGDGGGGENGRPGENAFLLLDERDAPNSGGHLVVARAFGRIRSRRQLKYRRALARAQAR